MTRLWLDVQALQGPFFERGIARFVRGVAIALHNMGASIAGYGLNPSQGAVPDFHGQVAKTGSLTTTTATALRGAAAAGDLVYVCGSAFEGYRPIQNLWPNYLVIPHVPAAAIVYDTIPLRRVADFQATHERRRFYQARRRLLERADMHLAISRSTARELLEDIDVDAATVEVIGCGVDDAFRPTHDRDADLALARASVPRLRDVYLYYVGGFQPQKNVEGLLTAYSYLSAATRTDAQLVIGGSVPPEMQACWAHQADRMGIARDVVFTGFLPEPALLAVTRCAHLAVVPSLHEGFGLPAAEAIACGVPAITSDSSSLPEVVGWSPSTFDATEPRSIADRIEQALTDRAFNAELRQACARAATGHTWGAVARRLVAATDRLGRTATVDSSRPRLAVLAAGEYLTAAHDVATALIQSGASVDFISDIRSSLHGGRSLPMKAWQRTIEPTLYDAIVTSPGCPEHPTAIDITTVDPVARVMESIAWATRKPAATSDRLGVQ